MWKFFSAYKKNKSGFNLLNMSKLIRAFGISKYFGFVGVKEQLFIKKSSRGLSSFDKRLANINKMKEDGSRRGKRHERNMPVNGQRTKTNASTRRKFKRI